MKKIIDGWAVIQYYFDWPEGYLWTVRPTRVLAQQYKKASFDKKSRKFLRIIKCKVVLKCKKGCDVKINHKLCR